MDDRDITFLAFTLPALIIVGGVVVMVWGIRHATRQAELEHEERMAMIERGMTPSGARPGDHHRRSHGFKMSLGILLCGLGMGLLMLITFAAGEPGTGFGIGGAIAMVGIAFIISAMFTERQGPSMDERRAARHAGMHGVPPMVQRRTFDEPAPPPPADQP